MSALPPKRTWISTAVMSALCQKRTLSDSLAAKKWPRHLYVEAKFDVASETTVMTKGAKNGRVVRRHLTPPLSAGADSDARHRNAAKFRLRASA